MRTKYIAEMIIAMMMFTVTAEANVKFDIHRGVNIAHFLSQSDLRGEARANEFLPADIRQIASWGYDHVRLPVDEEQMFLDNGEKNDTAFVLLHQTLDECFTNGLRVIVDLHILRSHYFVNLSDNPLFTQREAQENFFECWRKLSEEMHQYPTDSLAYELLNEPQAENDDDWNRVATECYQLVRRLEPDRIIVLGSNYGQQLSRIPALAIPKDDPNIIISFHYYDPFLLTHYQAEWSPLGSYDGPVHYPGQLVRDDEIDSINEPWQTRIRYAPKESKYFDKEAHRMNFLKGKEIADQYGLRIICSEWGCLRSDLKEERLRYLLDMTEVFDELGIANTLWCYKEDGFGIVTPEGVDKQMLERLIK
ncbi:MAG: cellulase family glycosylhydrolase [Bacteroidales bacterium]|nr:cellulase family glycosylhydrolase [Bacteroidales bacterium]